MSYDIKVIDEKSPLFGKKLTGGIVYYDLYHTGNSPDLLQVQDEEGNKYQILSNRIDIEHYNSQEVAKETERLGAKVGDTVLITRSGSGYSKVNFNVKELHVITKIDCTGHVEFDNGDATMFRPDVELVV